MAEPATLHPGCARGRYVLAAIVCAAVLPSRPAEAADDARFGASPITAPTTAATLRQKGSAQATDPDMAGYAGLPRIAPEGKSAQGGPRRNAIYPDVPLVPCDAIGRDNARGRRFSCYGDLPNLVDAVPGPRTADKPYALTGAKPDPLPQRSPKPGSLTRLRPFSQ